MLFRSHVGDLLRFVRAWDRANPLVVHCYAGISRSTAGAFVTACALNPHRDEIAIARQIRAASPIASPNRLIVGLADKALGRDGRMLRALDEMGPGSMTVEGRPFRVENRHRGPAGHAPLPSGLWRGFGGDLRSFDHLGARQGSGKEPARHGLAPKLGFSRRHAAVAKPRRPC